MLQVSVFGFDADLNETVLHNKFFYSTNSSKAPQ